jgi:hypothetical protein
VNRAYCEQKLTMTLVSSEQSLKYNERNGKTEGMGTVTVKKIVERKT